jgi:hypothetical protein
MRTSIFVLAAAAVLGNAHGVHKRHADFHKDVARGADLPAETCGCTTYVTTITGAAVRESTILIAKIGNLQIIAELL